MTGIIDQARRLHASKGLIRTVRHLLNIRKVIDHRRGRLLRPLDKTVWGTYLLPVDDMLNCTLPEAYLPRTGSDAVVGKYAGS